MSPFGCLTKNCRECAMKIIASGKLRCNFNNRLGVASGEALKQFMPTMSEEEILAQQLEQRLKEVEELKKRQEELAKVGKGGEADGEN